MFAQPEAHEAAAEGFNAGEVIIEHVSNSSHDHPIFQLPTIYGIDFSVTKHVFMLWLVAAIVFLVVTVTVRSYVRQERLIPTGFMGVLEVMVEFIRDSISVPNVGSKWANVWTPLFLTTFAFILVANAIGLIPIFDVLELANHTFIHAGEESFFGRMLEGGVTATGNYNVTAGLAVITFFAIIVAGSRAHGFVKHWTNIVPHGLAPLLYVILIPIAGMGLFVRPFALTMRLAANMTGGHIAILAILSFVFLFAEMFGHALAGVGVGLAVSVPLAVGVSALEMLVAGVQAYVFALLTSLYINDAVHLHDHH